MLPNCYEIKERIENKAPKSALFNVMPFHNTKNDINHYKSISYSFNVNLMLPKCVVCVKK